MINYLTTHSPSTVALAPEDSIYAMNPDGPCIEKINRNAALSILTSGVPTLSVSFDGRRQVFVESRTDARLYDKLFQRYKDSLGSERSLVFLEVGKSDTSGGEKNAGCSQVKRLVNGLSQGGNKSVLGLIDWDGSNQGTERIHVLSPGMRDGLENLMFDPVLLIATIVRENPVYAKDKGILRAGDTYVLLGEWTQSRWQQVATLIQKMLFPNVLDLTDTQPVTYVNDMTLQISKTFLFADDHELEDKIVNTFEILKPKNKNKGALMLHIAVTILPDFQGLLPNDLLMTFRKLLSAEL